MSADELKRFYKSRVKKPDLFGYDDEGNLAEFNKEGGIVKTIPLPDYRTPSYEEIDEMEKKRQEAIAIANKEFEDARVKLRDLLSKPDTPQSEILRLNRLVKEADVKLLAVRFPLRFVEVDDGPAIKDIEFDKAYEKRKFPYDFYYLKERPFTLQEQYVRVGKAPVKPMVTVAEAKAAEDNVQIVIIFAEPDTNDYGFLSLKWVVELEVNGTKYGSGQQALYAELAKAFNDEEGLQRIMSAESPDEINYSLEDVPGEPDANRAKWTDTTKQLIYDINIAKFNQYPELAARLLETKNATLGAYIPDDTLIGIGISMDNVQSKNPVNWTGQNILGKALMEIRQNIRAERAAAEAAAEAQKPVVRRKKPSVAPATADATAAPIEVPAGQRTIRRRPQSVVSVPPEAIAQPLATMPSAVMPPAVVAPLQEETAEEE
jgi:ribA/ribD-fused uncharacterized protein